MNKILLLSFLTIISLHASDINSTKESNSTKENSSKKELNSSDVTSENIKKAIEQEKKFKQEQKFYLGDDYNLSVHKIDPKSVDKVPLIEPDYDFDMDDVYSD